MKLNENELAKDSKTAVYWRWAVAKDCQVAIFKRLQNCFYWKYLMGLGALMYIIKCFTFHAWNAIV